ncbi:hypothetical protein [Enterobacter cloacae]|uniref:hypothetical protein n=1 Tax=Enterobacter cloacae TaxID=550 RepID=UPI002074EDA9|nr:hypothetical protein [Enterobacter cloacae]MCM7495354.1 hypothetical protein [Enterobacter cloacae]
MAELTKEWLLTTIAELEEERDAVPGVVNEDAAKALEAMKIALVSLEAKDKIPELRQVIYHFRDWNEGFPIERFKADYVISWMLANYPPAQPTAVSVPGDVSGPLAHAYKELTPTFMRNHIDVFERYGIYPDGSAGIQAMRIALDGMNRRAAMLQGADGNSPAHFRSRPAQSSLSPAQGGNSPVIPDCWCRTCRPVVLNDMRFVVCPDCGNKRCPRANDHKNSCTGSNEPGQEGSAYPASPQEVKGE